MDVARDLLDTRVLDRNGRDMGRIDSIVLRVEPGEPPRIVAIELGPSVLFARVSARLGRWAAALERALGAGDGNPVRIGVAKILRIHDHDVAVDLAIGESGAASVEHRLRRWVSALPRSS